MQNSKRGNTHLSDSTPASSQVRTNSFKAWLLASRPKTLTSAATPVLIGLSYAYFMYGQIEWTPAILCLLFAFIMQIDANFVNDYFDFKKGTDDETRLGPKRACAEGWITLSAMKLGLIITSVLACVVGSPLIIYGGWPMVIVGVVCVLFCFLYTTSLSYKGLGDVLVLVFFGVVPIVFTSYVQKPEISLPLILLGLSCGIVIDTLLVVNNFRDRETDLKAGKITLIVRIGERWGCRLYLLCGLLGVIGAPWTLYLLARDYEKVQDLSSVLSPWMLPVLIMFVLLLLYLKLHIGTYRALKRIWQGRALNAVLGNTAFNIFIYGLLVSIGLLIADYWLSK